MAVRHSDTECVVDILSDTRDSLPDTCRDPNKIIWTAMEDGVRAIMRFPNREAGWLKGSSNVWRNTGHSLDEIRKAAKAKLMEGVKPDVMPEIWPGMDEDRAMLVMSWFGFCRDDEDDALQKAAFNHARGDHLSAMAFFRPGATPNVRTLNHIKLIATVAIRNGLRETYGVEIGKDGVLIVEDVA